MTTPPGEIGVQHRSIADGVMPADAAGSPGAAARSGPRSAAKRLVTRYRGGWLISTETLLEPRFVTATSGRPSPLKSLSTMDRGLIPTAK